ncbi:toll/interleukin-1 receptor domain-containing protein [Rhizobium panacihumi]|uniref:toll/interleukin-1 receptor domain-containing protein n=1 Tax=Rhizobium panacihumi TaxID=2008450 RepID=UPI003D78FEE0
MPIFISHSHQDKAFVDNLAKMLVVAKHHVWVDRWELKLGDSLTSKIQESLTTSSAILVILSKSSVASEWCKRELNAGLIRELEEKNTIVMPVVIDDCTIPLFLRDKLYANFDKDPDEAFNLIDSSLARISNPSMSRFLQPEHKTDYAFDWRSAPATELHDGWLLRWTFIDHADSMEFSILSECRVYASDEGEEAFFEAATKGREVEFGRDILEAIGAILDQKPLVENIEDSLPKVVVFPVKSKGHVFVVQYNYRRLGIDQGTDTIVYLDNHIKLALDYMNSVMKRRGN